jgi:2-polyprenyl-6-methoxyphenol hydroxylase-like FAD-dependent oxidoreductase
MDSVTDVYDVVQIGYGPVGQTCSALLGRAGWRVGVFERHPGLYALPRAGHVDHEIMRIFQSIGAAEAMTHDMFRCARYGWRNQHGETLLDIDWGQEGISGWASDYLFYQPYVEEALDAAVRRFRGVEVNHGWEAMEIRQDGAGVEVDLARRDPNGEDMGERRTVRGRYLVGADGANSIVRDACGIGFDDLGFREQWLVTDFRQKHPLSFEFDNGQICDPARPLCLFQLGKTHRRFEFMVLPGEDGQELTRPERVWELVSRWMTPDDAELIRAAVYTFRSASAQRWRSGRAVLVGDAAHLMPPFLGQGMCSGVRDAANLAWKLDLALAGKAPDDLLDTFELERKPHVGEIIEQAVALGRISCTVDPVAAHERDLALLSGDAPPPPPFPWLISGVLQRGAGARAQALVGRLGPQGFLGRGATARRADDHLGSGWRLLAAEPVGQPLSPAAQRVADLIGLKVVEIGEGDLADAAGFYRQYFKDAAVRAVLVRPDFYVFGALEGGERLDGLLADLGEQLGLEVLTAAET